MANNQIKTRIIHKHDIEANWKLATNFIPKQGEIIIYDKDTSYNYERFKIGDGSTLVSSLPFANDALKSEIQTLLNNKASTSSVSQLASRVDNKVDKDGSKVLSTNDYTTTEKNKLAGIASNAEVNQNAFSNVVVGSTTISADSKTDTLTLVASTNITLTPDASGDKITISAKDTTYSNATTSAAGLMSADDKTKLNAAVNKLDGIAEGANKITVDSALSSSSTNPVQNKVINSALSGKQATITGAATTITGSNLTASRVLVSDSNGKVAASSNITTTELGYLDGVTSGIQNQLDNKLPKNGNVSEANLVWGGKNFSGSYGPLDASMISVLGADRLAFVKPTGVIIEYSTDSGATWVDYGADNALKGNLFSSGGTIANNLVIGKNSTGSKALAPYMLRVTIVTKDAQIYTTLNKFAINISTSQSTGCYCTIEKALESTPTVYETVVSKEPITGWSGWNIINVPGITTYGNTAASQYGRLRFTFGCTGGTSTSQYFGLNVRNIMGFGGMGHTTPSNMAKYGHLYSWDSSQNATFPAKVTASGGFSGSLSGNATSATKATQDASGNVITSTYATKTEVNNKVDKVSGKGLSTNDFTATLKSKLDGIASGAQVNQNAFSKVSDGTTTITADTTTDTLTLAAGSNISLALDSTNDKVTISATNTTYSAAGSSLGLVKSGGDVTISSGVITVNDDSHNHVIDNIDNLKNTLDKKIAAEELTVTTSGTGNAITSASYDSGTRTITLNKGASYNNYTYTLPSAGSSLGGVKSGGDVTISSGVITVNDDSHNHIISNVDGLQNALDAKASKSDYETFKTNVNTLLDSDDTTLDQMSEIVAYTKNNKGLIDSITTSKQNKITGAATTITGSNLTANRVLISDGNGKVAASSSVTTTELGYLDGVTSGIQNQLDGKASAKELDNRSYLTQKYTINAGDANTHYYKLFTITPSSKGYGDLHYIFEISARSNAFTKIHVFVSTASEEKYLSSATITYDGSLGTKVTAYRFKDTTNKIERLEIWGEITSWNTWKIMPKTYQSSSYIDLEWNGEEGSALPTNATTNVSVTARAWNGNASSATKATQDANGKVITSTYATKTELGNKVDKVSGKGLSTNDFTTALKNKLDGIAENANNYSLPTASSSTKGGVKTGAAISDTTGYTAVHIKDGVIYYKDTNTNLVTSVFGRTGAVVLTKSDVTTALGYTPPTTNTTYSAATYAALGLVKPAYSSTGAATLTTAAASNSSTPTIAAKTTTSGRYYGVEVDKNGVLFVNVPWSNAVSSVAGKTGAVTLAKGDVGLGNVENKSSATIRGELTKDNVTTALGYTPPTTNTTYTAGTGLSLSSGAFSVKTGYTTSGKNYKVQADSNGNLYVNVPWTDSTPVTSVFGRTGAVTLSKSDVTTALGYTPPTTNTTYSTATYSTLGLVKPAYTSTNAASLTTTAATNTTTPTIAAKTTTSGRYYAVEADKNGLLFVNVPWSNTHAVSSVAGKTGAVTLAKSDVGLGNVENKSSATIRGELTKTDVTTALGYTPPTTDTNTHYTTRLYAGASGTAANATATNPYLKITDDNTYRNQVRFVGSGATTVSSDANGNITISSTDTNTQAVSSVFGRTGAVTLTKADVTTALGYTPPTTDTNTTYSTATSSTLGLVKIGYQTSGKNYAVQLSNGQMYVNVPWTDNNTTYSAGTGLSLSGTTFNHSNSITAGSVGSAQSPSHGGTFAIPKITYDAQGHITGATTVNITLPGDNNSDTKVTQTVTSSNASYPLLLAPSGQTATTTTTAYFDSGITLNPSTNSINGIVIDCGTWS